MCKHLGRGRTSPCLLNFSHYVTNIPPEVNPTGLFYENFAYLLNNHHQDGKRKGAIERVQDVTRVRRAAAVDVLAVEGVENIAAVCRFATVERLTIPSIENVTGVVGLSSIDIFAVPGVQDVARVGGTTFIDVFAVEGIEDIAAVGRVPAV